MVGNMLGKHHKRYRNISHSQSNQILAVDLPDSFGGRQERKFRQGQKALQRYTVSKKCLKRSKIQYF